MGRKPQSRGLALAAAAGLCAAALSGCASPGDGRQIIRIGHNQATDHPTHLGLEAFAAHIETELGTRYQVEVYPNELLGSQTEMVQLTQTGAIDFVVASNSILETFSTQYSIFNLPYLFASTRAYHAAMDDPAVVEPIFDSTVQAGIRAVTWLDAGTRNFYTVDRPILTPADLKGLKIRVQQSPTNVQMMALLGGSATPMGFGEVYTALQSGVIDGAENNELALTSNGHGDVCKHYSYDMHQMIPDIVLGNCAFLDGLSEEEREIFEEGFRIINAVQRENWTAAAARAGERAQTVQKVTFHYPDTEPFRQLCSPMHRELIDRYPGLEEIYDRIMEHNAAHPAAAEKGAGE